MGDNDLYYRKGLVCLKILVIGPIFVLGHLFDFLYIVMASFARP